MCCHKKNTRKYIVIWNSTRIVPSWQYDQIRRSVSPSLHLQYQVVAVGVLVARRVGPFRPDP